MDPTTYLRITTGPLEGYTAVVVHGELDIAAAPVLRERLLGVLHHRGPHMIVDLSGVSFCDATGLAALVATKRRAHLLGGSVRLASPQQRVATVLRITSLDQHFGVYPTVAAAVDRSHPAAGNGVMDSPVESRSVLEHPTRAWEHVHAAKIRHAVGGVLAHTDAWHDADPERWLTPTLRDLATAHHGADPAALADAARGLLTALTRHPLVPSPPVVDTATQLRRLLEASHRTSLN